MTRTFTFDNLSDAVAACEQLADNMVPFDFRTQPDFIITTRGELSRKTHEWLLKVTNNLID